MVWTAHILSLFPEMFPGPLGTSLAGKGLARGDWAMTVTDIRDFAVDRHRTVDDSPFGGGAGMVMGSDVLAAAIDAAREHEEGLQKALGKAAVTERVSGGVYISGVAGTR